MGQAEAILDFGSSKVVCMVGKCSDTGRFEIYGIGSCEHKGLKKGRFLDEPGLRVAVQKTIDAAQTEARRHIRTVHVGVPGPFVKVQCGECELRISDTPVEITHRDIDRLMEKAVEESVSVEGYTRALSVPFHYEVDGSARSSIPIGVTGSVLKAEISHSYIESGFEDFCTQLLDEMGIEVATFIDAASAEATMLIPEKDMDVESIVADVGYYHTDVLIMRDSACVYRTTLPVGGVHIANDVTYVLGISPAVAENIKQRHAFGLDYTDRVDTYRLTDGTAESIVYEEIQDIIEARANEIGRMVRKAVLQSGVKVPPDTVLYLVGGGIAMMRGNKELFQLASGYQTVTDMPWMPRKNTPNFASAYGMLNYVCRSDLGLETHSPLRENRIVQSLINFFTK